MDLSGHEYGNRQCTECTRQAFHGISSCCMYTLWQEITETVGKRAPLMLPKVTWCENPYENQ